MCSSGEPHYHTCCDDHEDHAAECRNMSCYCYPSPARYRNGEKSHGHSNGWHEDGRGAKKKKKLGGIWDESETKEREKLKDFWLGLGDSQRQSLLRIEKESILREMREQQRHICSCSVCGRRRTVLEEELELLYDAYYSELEDRGDSGEIDIEMIDYQSDEVDLSLSLKAVEGGVLTVADDLLMDDGRKFFSLMEKLADGRAQNGYDQMPEQYGYGDQEGEYDDENYQEEDEELLEEQRIEEGRRMFQMFAAKMFEQRVLAAYREKVALEKQEQLMQEEEEEEKLQAERRENKARKERERKQKKKELKKQQDSEKERKRIEKEEEEKALREKELKEREEKRKEKQRQKEEEKKRKEEEARRKSLELREKAKAEKDVKVVGKAASDKAKDNSKPADGGQMQLAEKKGGMRSAEKEANEKQSKSSKKKAKKEKAALESGSVEVVQVDGDEGVAEGWEVAQGKHKKKAVLQEQQREIPEPGAKKVADETLAVLRSTGAARHYEQNGSHQSTPVVIPPGFQRPCQAPSHPVPAAHPSHPPQRHAPVSYPSQMMPPSAHTHSESSNSAPLGGGAIPVVSRVVQEQQLSGGYPMWPEHPRAEGANVPWHAHRSRMEPSGVHPQFLTQTVNHPLNHPAHPPVTLPQQASFPEDVPRLQGLGVLSIDVDQELSSSMEHLLPGGLLSATGDTPRGLNPNSGFEEGFARLQLLENRPPTRDPYGVPIRAPRPETEQPFHDANGHFRHASGSESPESLGSPDSTWSFGRRPGSGSNSSGKMSRPASGEVGRPWMYANGGEEPLRAVGMIGGDGALRPQSGNRRGVALGQIAKAARQDVRVSWDGSQGQSGDPSLFEMVRSASHPALPAGSSPPMGGISGQHLPPHFQLHPPQSAKPSRGPAGKSEWPFDARLESAILVLRSAVAREEASGVLAQPLSLSAFWQSLLAIDPGLLNEGITRAHILGIWVELAKQQIVRVGHGDPTRPNEPFILAILPPPVPDSGNKLGVCLMCSEGLASVQLRPCSHLTCVACTSQLAAQADFGELCCPFCAQIVQSSATLGPDGHFLPSAHEGRPQLERRADEHPQMRSPNKAHQMKAKEESGQDRSSVNGHRVPRQEATRIDSEWPTLEAAVSVGGVRKAVEPRPVSRGTVTVVAPASSASGQSRPPSSNCTVSGEASRKAGWGTVPKASAGAQPAKAASANGSSKAPSHESSAWPSLDAAAKGRRKGGADR